MTIQTERLQIEPIRTTEGDFMLSLLNTEGWLRYIGDRQVRTAEDAVRYIQKILQTENLSYRVVRLKTDGHPIGIISFMKRDYLEHFDLGFAFLPAYTGRGFAFEAAKAVLEEVQQDKAHAVVLATTMPDNQSSIQLLQRLGFHAYRSLEIDGQQLLVYACPAPAGGNLARPSNNA